MRRKRLFAQGWSMKQPLLHFDVFGPVKHVLRELDLRVARIFPEATEAFLDNLKALVRRYADQNHWDIVAVSLSKGMARQLLDDIVKVPLPRSGPLIIDPTGHTSDHQLYEHDSALRSAHERLTRVNEITGDILVIIFGVEEMTREVLQDFLMRRVRTTEWTLDLLDNEDLPTSMSGDLINWRVSEGRQWLNLAGALGGFITAGTLDVDARTLVDNTGNRLLPPETSAAYLAHLAGLWGFSQIATTPAARRTLSSLYEDNANLVDDFKDYGIVLPPPPPRLSQAGGEYAKEESRPQPSGPK